MKGGIRNIYKMMNKKAQGQIITTVLIILLVLAAIVIVWQVVNSTVTRGGEEIESQSACLGLTIGLTASNGGAVTIRPNRDIDGFRVYKGGTLIDSEVNGGGLMDSTAVGAFETDTTTDTVITNDVITSAGKIGSQWCEGMQTITVE